MVKRSGLSIVRVEQRLCRRYQSREGLLSSPSLLGTSPSMLLKQTAFLSRRSLGSGVGDTGPHRGVGCGSVPCPVSEGLEGHPIRERDLAVTAAAIMTRTAATTMAMIQRTQSMPGLPLPPNAV
jgi:hypothetical protein